MSKILTIAWKDIYTTYRDRNLVLIMIAAPLAVATIIGLAFGGLASGDVPVKDIPIAIVNLDKGSGDQNFGAIFVNVFIPSESEASATAADCETGGAATNTDGANESALQELTNAVRLDDPAAARAGVDKAEYTAAIIIPEDFSQKISFGQNKPIEPSSIEVYANSGRQISAGIIRSIVEGIGNQIATGNITVAATVTTLLDKNPLFGLQFLNPSTFARFNGIFSCAFVPAVNKLVIEQQTIAGQKSTSAAALLVVFGAAQAMFFTLFTGQGGVLSVFEERRQGTLQRLVVSPTTRVQILAGKLAGTFLNCVVQLIFLMISLTLVASILSGGFTFIWGSNFIGLAALILGSALAATGLGTLLAGLAKSPEQAGIYSSVLNIGLAVLGGSFGFQLPESLSRFSLIYWGTDGFRKLAAGQGDITLNVLILLAHGVILFLVGLWLFNRRLDL